MAEFHTTSGRLADPQFRRERARDAALASHSIGAHVRAVIRAKDDLTPEQRAEIRAAVDAWPPLTAEQREQLALLLHQDDPPAADET